MTDDLSCEDCEDWQLTREVGYAPGISEPCQCSRFLGHLFKLELAVGLSTLNCCKICKEFLAANGAPVIQHAEWMEELKRCWKRLKPFARCV